jgi:hypothetical protein
MEFEGGGSTKSDPGKKKSRECLVTKRGGGERKQRSDTRIEEKRVERGGA